MATSTPWGPAQDSQKIAVGIMFYSTARHGGIHLSPKRNKLVPDYMRNDNGWYEEDCEWAIPTVVFENEFKLYTPSLKAKDTLRNWFPAAYEAFYGVELKEGESFKRDQEIAAERNKDKLVVISAINEDGAVRCTATVGGVRDFSKAREFIVPASEYAKRSSHGFVIDEKMHREVSIF